MPVPHRRKKAKHFQPPPHKILQSKNSNAKSIFAITGAVIGFTVGYIITGELLWAFIILLTGSFSGFLFGRSIDNSTDRNI
jgi:multisubunit Na+/H+ antiporter MnhG subunit